MTYKDLKPHPLANIFPMIADEDRAEFRKSIAEHGLQERIVLLDGRILDGRNRYRELQELGRENDARNFVKFEDLTAGQEIEPIDFVMTRNMARRHMSESQRAMSAARAANMRQGERTDLQSRGGLDNSTSGAKISAGHAAELFKVSERAVNSASKVLKDGVEELQGLVDTGRVAVSVAEKLAHMPQEDQTRILAETKPEALKNAAKKAERDRREKALAEKQAALPIKKYGVIVADCEWNFATRSENGMDRAAGNHYRTSPLEELCRRRVSDIAADDAVLFMWATVPMLVEAFCVADAWGFCTIERNKLTGFLEPHTKSSRYVSSWDWIKDKIATGYWGRNKHEILLIFTKGRPVAPALGTQPASVLDVPMIGVPGMPAESAVACQPAREHSRKPDIFMEWIEKLWPTTPKIELNARRARAGWDLWGDEAPDGAADKAPDERTSDEDKAVIAEIVRKFPANMDLEAIADLYALALQAYNSAIISKNESLATEAFDQARALCLYINGGKSFGVAVNDDVKTMIADAERKVCDLSAGRALFGHSAAFGGFVQVSDIPEYRDGRNTGNRFSARIDAIAKFEDCLGLTQPSRFREASISIYATEADTLFPSSTGYHGSISVPIWGAMPVEAAMNAVRFAVRYSTDKKVNQYAKGLSRPERVYVIDPDGDVSAMPDAFDAAAPQTEAPDDEKQAERSPETAQETPKAEIPDTDSSKAATAEGTPIMFSGLPFANSEDADIFAAAWTEDNSATVAHFTGKHTPVTDAIIRHGYHYKIAIATITKWLGLPPEKKGIVKGRANRLGLTDPARIAENNKARAKA